MRSVSSTNKNGRKLWLSALFLFSMLLATPFSGIAQAGRTVITDPVTIHENADGITVNTGKTSILVYNKKPDPITGVVPEPPKTSAQAIVVPSPFMTDLTKSYYGRDIDLLLESSEQSKRDQKECIEGDNCRKFYSVPAMYMPDHENQKLIIKEHGRCQIVKANKLPQHAFIPTNTADELQSFMDNKPEGIQTCDCFNFIPHSADITFWRMSSNRYRLGTVGDNYWKASCGLFQRAFTFHITDVSDLKQFRLIWVGWDDWYRFRVNGQEIDCGPTECNNPRFGSPCELKTSWTRDRDIDLRPYLVDGENTIEMDIIVSGAGEGWFDIIAESNCAIE